MKTTMIYTDISVMGCVYIYYTRWENGLYYVLRRLILYYYNDPPPGTPDSIGDLWESRKKKGTKQNP